MRKTEYKGLMLFCVPVYIDEESVIGRGFISRKLVNLAVWTKETLNIKADIPVFIFEEDDGRF